jgi:anaerobic magnesium-protoporphyrin IX monomethyl ester cyclase
VREISIGSDEFNPVLPWAIEICQEIRKLCFKDLFFQGNIRADKVTDELAREMKKSNFWLAQLGIESGNQRTLDGIGKKITLEQVVQTCRLLKKHGIKVYGYIMIYHAWEENGRLCHETPKDVDRTLDFIRRLKRERLLDYMSFSTTTPMRGSRLFELAKRHNMLEQDTKVRDLSEFSMILPNISKRAMKRSRLKGLLLQLSMNLRSGHNYLLDWSKNWHKAKTFLKSI